MPKQDISCSVNQCRFNDHENHCNKDSIVVGCNVATAHNQCDTQCSSFEESN